ncbi:MAG: phage/plasmid primase, P4 family [Alistipes senegalensis]|nr:phage/plasmid primase, P4 family [Alistipes senegalensis]
MYEKIPDELKRCPQWVCWRSEPDPKSHSGIKKIPINPKTGGQAMSNNPETWSDFETAVRVSRNYSGIGFMFSGSGYFGVDLDDCLPEIDGFYRGEKNFVSDFVDGLKSYTELSQSCHGLHIICRGSLPEGARRKGKFEMYDKGRYFIMTGNPLDPDDVLPVADCTESVKMLHKKYLSADKPKKSVSVPAVSMPEIPVNMSVSEIIEKAFASKSGEKFRRLYNGDFSDYPSQSEADMAFCNMLAFWCGRDTTKMDDIFRQSGLMRDKWDRKQSGSTYGKLMLKKAVENCQEVYNAQKTGNYSISFGGTPVNMHSLDDTGNAQRMYDLCGDMMRYCYTDRRWLCYSAGKWQYDTKGSVFVWADKVLESMKSELKLWAEYQNGEMLPDYQKHMKKSRSNNSKRAMVKEMEHLVAVSPNELDADKFLVNVKNGVLNLNDFSVASHKPDFLMTRMLGTSMPKSPKRPEKWLSFLDQIFSGDKELIRYIQKALGYSLSGDTSEQCAFFLYGTGRNGKSTFLEVVRKIMGDYATNIQPESIMVKASTNTANSDIARLKGARLVTSVEPNEGMRLNEGLLKQLTGDDMITARKLYGDEFEFRPEFKLWMATNHKPTIRGTDLGIWRRIHIIPFCVTIPEEVVDKNLSQKLMRELPDILAWIVDGYKLWKMEGLRKPKVIEDAVEEYRNEMDVISAFLASDYVVQGGEVKAQALYAVYCQWCSESNEYKMSSTKFGREIAKRYNKVRKNSGFFYDGISIDNISIG